MADVHNYRLYSLVPSVAALQGGPGGPGPPQLSLWPPSGPPPKILVQNIMKYGII